MKTYIFIDGEYTYTCACREGKVVDYAGLIKLMNVSHIDNVKLIYFVGMAAKKKGLSDFLIKAGMDYINTIPFTDCSKTQVVASTLALDVAKLAIAEPNSTFAFVTGDDYMMPIIHFLTERSIPSYIYYFPVICYSELHKMSCRMNQLPNLFMFPKKAV